MSVKVSERIRSRRRELGISQTRLAEDAGISHSFLCDIDLRDRNLSVATLRRIAEVLGIKMEYFFID